MKRSLPHSFYSWSRSYATGVPLCGVSIVMTYAPAPGSSCSAVEGRNQWQITQAYPPHAARNNVRLYCGNWYGMKLVLEWSWWQNSLTVFEI